MSQFKSPFPQLPREQQPSSYQPQSSTPHLPPIPADEPDIKTPQQSKVQQTPTPMMPTPQLTPQSARPVSQQTKQPPPVKRPVPKQSLREVWIIISVIAAIAYAAGYYHYASPSSSPSSTTSSSATGTWTTVQTFSGNGNEKTGIFSAPGDWKMLWTCYGFNDGTGVNGTMIVNVYNADGSVADFAAISATCQAGSQPTTGETEEHQSGQVYLDIGASGQWSIQIQDLQ